MIEHTSFLIDLETRMADWGFKRVPFDAFRLEDCRLLLKRQTLNTNRAVCVLGRRSMPEDFRKYVKRMRRLIAFKVRFVPFFLEVGIQLVIVCPGIIDQIPEPGEYVAKFSNQWAIVQSLFLIDPEKGAFIEGRSWGQLISQKWQDSISIAVSNSFEMADRNV